MKHSWIAARRSAAQSHCGGGATLSQGELARAPGGLHHTVMPIRDHLAPAELRANLERRLAPTCAHLPAADFAALVAQMVARELTDRARRYPHLPSPPSPPVEPDAATRGR